MKVGFGYDAHALVEGVPLMLGGVQIPFDRGLKGHSDGDVLCHAIADAILGAAALGDLGLHFPSSEEEWRGVPSVRFIEKASQMIIAIGLTVSSLDATVVCEQPAIAPHREDMRAHVALAAGMSADDVSVKATTTDGLGATGRGEGIAAFAVAVLAER